MYQRLISSSQFSQCDQSKWNPMLFESYRIKDKLLLLSETFWIRIHFRTTVNWEWKANGEKQQFYPFLLSSAWLKNYQTKQNKKEKKIGFLDSIDVSSNQNHFSVAMAFNDVVSIGHLTITAWIPCALFKLSDKLSSSTIIMELSRRKKSGKKNDIIRNEKEKFSLILFNW